MTSAEENRVRKLVHGFLYSDITATEFREELDRITGRKKHNKARKASLSVATLDRIEKSRPCRLDTKKKIAAALGFNPWLNDDRTSFSER